MPEFILISDGEDDIISMPGPSKPRISAPRPPSRAPVFVDSSDEEELPKMESMSQLMSSIMAEPRPDLNGKRKAPAAAPRRSMLLDLLDDEDMRLDTPNSDEDVPLVEAKKKKTAAKKPKVDEGSKRDKEDEAARKRAQKEVAKNQEKETKAREKEEAKLAKEIARSKADKEKDINKLVRDKHDAVRNVHMWITPDLETTSSPIAAALPEIRARLESDQSKVNVLSEHECTLDGTIRFKRHVKGTYDGKQKKWVSVEKPYWDWESTTLLVVQADEIVDLIATKTDGLVEWASDARLTLGLQKTDQIIVLIKGLYKYYAKSKTILDREFAAEARAALGDSNPIRRGAGKRLDKDRIEGELVRLQVAERCFIVHVEKTEEIETWIVNIAGDIALRPYKLLQKNHLNFCPDETKTKGKGPSDTFGLMLQCVGMTSSEAAGILEEYSTFRELMEAYEAYEKRGKDPALLLRDCRKRNLVNGTMSDKCVGQAISKRVYHFFRCEDSLALA